MKRDTTDKARKGGISMSARRETDVYTDPYEVEKAGISNGVVLVII